MARFDRVIRGGMIVDGSRLPRFRGDIGIKDGRIAEIGQIGAGEADETIDAGGLIVAPIFIRHYQRVDGTFLVLTSRQLVKEARDVLGNYEVVDALIVPPPASGVQFTISCVQGQDETLRFIPHERSRHVSHRSVFDFQAPDSLHINPRRNRVGGSCPLASKRQRTFWAIKHPRPAGKAEAGRNSHSI